MNNEPWIIEIGAISDADKEAFMRAFKEWATKPMQIRAMYADRPQVHPARCDWYDSTQMAIAAQMAIELDEQLTRKPYRVFYDCGVYEWYVNTGRAPLWEYRKRGELVGAYNVRAGICAPFAQLKNKY